MAERPNHGEAVAWAVLLWTFVATTLRTLRWPNDFAEAHWLLDYRFGFVRRGLVGTMLTLALKPFGLRKTPMLIAALSLVSLSILVGTMLHVFDRIRARHEDRSAVWAMGVLFASSPFVVLSGHTLGYFDAILYVLAIAAIALVLRDRPFWAAAVSSIGLLCHESYLLVGFPLVALASAAAVTASGGRARWAPHLGGLALTLAAFGVLSLLSRITADPRLLEERLATYLESFRFAGRQARYVALWNTTPLAAFLRRQFAAFDLRLLWPGTVACMLPPLLALLAFLHERFGLRAGSPLSLLVLACVTAPLAMHAAAWDTERISSYPIAGAFLAIWILSETRPACPDDNVFWLLALPALILNIFIWIPLMDDEMERFDNVGRIPLYVSTIALFAVELRNHLLAGRPPSSSSPAAA